MEMEALNLNTQSQPRQLFDPVQLQSSGQGHNHHSGDSFGPGGGSTTIEFMLRSFDHSHLDQNQSSPALFAFNNGLHHQNQLQIAPSHPLMTVSCPTSTTQTNTSSESTNILPNSTSLSMSTSRNLTSTSSTLDLDPTSILQHYESNSTEFGEGSSSSSPETEGEGVKGSRPHACNMCDASYKTRTHLRRHMVVHLVSRPYPCPDCGKGFNRKEHLSKHAEAVHSAVKFICPFCEKQISRKDHLARHIKNMHPSYADFLNKDGFLSDVSTSLLKVPPPKGTKRSKSKRSPSSRPSNSKLVQLPPPQIRVPVMQSIASMGSTTSSQPQRQEWGQLENEQTSPTTRSQIFLDNDALQHIQQFAGIPACIVISGQVPPATVTLSSTISSTYTPPTVTSANSFTSTSTTMPLKSSKVQSHLQKPANPSPNGLLGLTNLSMTLGGQIKEAPFAQCSSDSKKISAPAINLTLYCPECSLNFGSEKDLASHIRSHKSPNFRCSECPRAYTRREKLTEHVRCFHQGEKFRCEHCGKELSRKDHVLRHVRSIHPEFLASRFNAMTSGELPENLVMDQDDQGRLSFQALATPTTSTHSTSTTPSSTSNKTSGQTSTSNSAVNEMNTLLRSICQYCLKVFGTSYHLSRHVESCHSGDLRPYHCPTAGCSKMFKRKDHLSKHLKSHCHTGKDTSDKRLTSTKPSTPQTSSHPIPCSARYKNVLVSVPEKLGQKKPKPAKESAKSRNHPSLSEEPTGSEDFNLVMINSFGGDIDVDVDVPDSIEQERLSSMMLNQDLTTTGNDTPPTQTTTTTSANNDSSLNGLRNIQFSNF